MTALAHFRTELGNLWQKLPGIGWFLVLATAWSALFVFLGNATLGYVVTPSLFGWLDWVCSRKSGDEHIPYILCLVLVLFWRQRQEIAETPKRMWLPGFLVLLLGMFFHLLGYSAFQECRFSMVGFFVGLYGLMGLVWGPQFMRATFFPFLLFSFFIPIGGTLGDKLTFPLRVIATNITAHLSHGIGIGVIQEGTRIYDANGSFTYEVAAECSGIRSLMVTLMVATIYSFVGLKTWWRRGVMLCSAIPLAVAANVARLLTIILAAETFGQSAGNTVHESWWMSLVPYVPMFLGIFGLGRWLKEPAAISAQPQTDSPRWEISDLKVPVGAVAIAAGFYFTVPAFGHWFDAHPFTVVIIGTALVLGWLAGPVLLERSQIVEQGWNAFAGNMALVAVVLCCQVGMASLLVYRHANQKLGLPGVKLVAEPVFGEKGQVVGTNRVELPPKVLNFESEQTPLAQKVLDWLPKDTTFGQRTYTAPDGFWVQMNAVLMGTDRTSIHKPQYCLEGTGWHIEKSEITSIRIEEPVAYDLPIMKLSTTREWTFPDGRKSAIHGIFVYWFVSEDQLSADHDQRMLWAGLDMLRTGVLKRWAYVSCFGICLPGQEESAYGRLKALITASVPQFQSVSSPARLAYKK
jgi:exosortase